MKHRFKIDKLVRDNIPAIIRSNGAEVLDRVMEQDEYLKRLKDKILEEAKEVTMAGDALSVKEELADVLEVVRALAMAYGISYEEIEAERVKKRKEKGGFEGKIYSNFIEIDDEYKKIDYYLAKQNQYPKTR